MYVCGGELINTDSRDVQVIKAYYTRFFFFFLIKRVLAKGKQKYVEKKSRFLPDLVKRTVGEKKQGMQVNIRLHLVLNLLL